MPHHYAQRWMRRRNEERTIGIGRETGLQLAEREEPPNMALVTLENDSGDTSERWHGPVAPASRGPCTVHQPDSGRHSSVAVAAVSAPTRSFRIVRSLIGRDDEIAGIDSFLSSLETRGNSVMLVGEPGVGKSSLLDVGAEAATTRGIRVVHCVVTREQVEPGISVAKQLVSHLADEITRVGATHRRTLQEIFALGRVQPGTELDVATAVFVLLQRLAVERPILIVIDNAEAVDRPSATVLSFLAHRIAGARIGLLVASRSGCGDALQWAIPELAIGPLEEASASNLLDETFPALSDRAHRRVLAEAHGNPMALVELPLALNEAQRAGYGLLPWPLMLTDRLRAAMAPSVNSIPVLTRRLLLLLALGQEGDLALIEPKDGQSGHLSHLVPAEELGLISVNFERTRVTFRSPLVRAAVVDLSTPEERRVAHRALADLLCGQPERQAWHSAEAAGEPLDELAEGLERAALRVLRAGGVSEAVSLLVRAAQMSTEAGDRARRLAHAAGVEASIGGQRDIAMRLLSDARVADPGITGSVEYATAHACLLLDGDGDMDLVCDVLANALESCQGGQERRESQLLPALYVLASSSWLGADPKAWETLNEASRHLARSTREELQLFQVCFTDPVRATRRELDLMNVAIMSLEHESDPRRIIGVALSSLHLDRVSRCRPALRKVVDSGRAGEAVALAIDALMILSLDAFLAGQWDLAGRRVAEGFELSSKHGLRTSPWGGWYTAAMIAAASGRRDEVDRLIGELWEWATSRGAQMAQHYASHARAFEALGKRDFEMAFIQAGRVSAPGRLEQRVPLSLWTCLDLVEAAVRTGRTKEAAEHVATMKRKGISSLSPRLALLTMAAAALVAPDDSFSHLFEKALTEPGVDRWPFDVARVRLLFGERLRRARCCTEARTQLSAALETFERLGAHPWSTRTAKELRATGLPGTRTGDRNRVTLTAQEHEIALLAAAGLTNKEIGERLFLSHRTVGAHLYRIFPKLGITSRAALRDALDDRAEPT